MRFVETSVFTRQIRDLLSDAEYRGLQSALILRPEQGALIRQSGGLRKVRWRTGVSGKRGGMRVIYYWDQASETFFMLFAYSKAMQDALSRAQLKILRQVVREELR